MKIGDKILVEFKLEGVSENKYGKFLYFSRDWSGGCIVNLRSIKENNIKNGIVKLGENL